MTSLPKAPHVFTYQYIPIYIPTPINEVLVQFFLISGSKSTDATQ